MSDIVVVDDDNNSSSTAQCSNNNTRRRNRTQSNNNNTNNNNNNIIDDNANKRAKLDNEDDNNAQSKQRIDSTQLVAVATARQQSNNNNNTQSSKNHNDTDNTNNTQQHNNNSNISSSPTNLKDNQSAAILDRDEYECIVCFELPPAEIFQCSSGHLLCITCWRKITDSQNSVCPSCKVKIHRDYPHRSRAAEVTVARIPVQCNNSGCNQHIPFKQLNIHENELCDYRLIKCKYYDLGCDWYDNTLKYEQHIKNCNIRNMSSDELLTHVHSRQQEYENKLQQLHKSYETTLSLCNMLRKRCRWMEIKDIWIENDEFYNNIKCSKIFKCLGYTWEACISNDTNDQQQIKLYFKLHSNIKHKLMIEVFVLNGNNIEYNINPVLRRFVFRRNIKICEPFILPWNNQQAEFIHNLDSIHLRIGFLDVSAGKVKNSFTTLRSSRIHSSDSSDNEDNSSGYDEHDVVDLPYNQIDNNNDDDCDNNDNDDYVINTDISNDEDDDDDDIEHCNERQYYEDMLHDHSSDNDSSRSHTHSIESDNDDEDIHLCSDYDQVHELSDNNSNIDTNDDNSDSESVNIDDLSVSELEQIIANSYNDQHDDDDENITSDSDNDDSVISQ